MGKLDDPMFGTIPPDETVHLVFNLSQGEDARGPWNEKPFEYIEDPQPMGGFPPAPINPDDEKMVLAADEPQMKSKPATRT